MDLASPYRRPVVGKPVQYTNARGFVTAAVVTAAYRVVEPAANGRSERTVEYVNLRVIENMRTRELPHYEGVQHDATGGPNSWRTVEEAERAAGYDRPSQAAAKDVSPSGNGKSKDATTEKVLS